MHNSVIIIGEVGVGVVTLGKIGEGCTISVGLGKPVLVLGGPVLTNNLGGNISGKMIISGAFRSSFWASTGCSKSSA